MSDKSNGLFVAWARGDFEKVAEFPRENASLEELERINEATAAQAMIKRAMQLPTPTGVPLEDTAVLKVVTILHTSLPHHTGGYTGRAHGLMSGLAQKGVHIVGYTRPGFQSTKIVDEVIPSFKSSTVDGITYRHLRALKDRKLGEYQYMESCIPVYKAVFEKERPNVVHARSTYLIALPAIIAAHELGIPVVYEISGLWELVYQGRGESGLAARTEVLENASVVAADRVVTMNTSMAELLKERNSSRIEIGLVPNAVDPSRFNKVVKFEHLSSNAFDLGYVGSLVDYEGLDTLLDAVRILKDLGRKCTVKIVGTGAMKLTLEVQAQALGIADQIIFRGGVPADQAPGEFDDIRIIVLPRLSTPATENVTPLKPYEAMAARRPLLVSSVDALSEVSDNGKYAAVFESGNAENLAKEIQELLDDRERQREITANGFGLIRRDHSWNYVAERMLDEFRSIAQWNSKLKVLNSSVRARRRGLYALSQPERLLGN